MDDPIRMYLREIGRYTLLTHELEIAYGTQVQHRRKLMEAKESLTKQLCREPTVQEWCKALQLSEAELNETLRLGQRAKQKMVEANLRLVVAIAKRYQRRGLELLDLFQEGAMGLTRAVERFDPDKGFRLSTYSYWWIRQAITRAIAEKGRTIRLPIHITERLNKIKKAQRQLSQHLGRTPTISEIATELDFTQQQVRSYLGLMIQPISLDLRVGDNHDTDLAELLQDSNATPEELLFESESANDLEPLLADLTPQQRAVLTLRFGLEDGISLTFQKTGQKLNISRERARQLAQKAIKRLRANQDTSRES